MKKLNRLHKWQTLQSHGVEPDVYEHLIRATCKHGIYFNLRECINCGLQKVSEKIHRTPMAEYSTIYFIKSETEEPILQFKILSKDVLPYKCDVYAKYKTGKKQLLPDSLFEIDI